MTTLEAMNQLTFTVLLLPFGVVLAVALIFGLLILKHVRKNRDRWDLSERDAASSPSRDERWRPAWSLFGARRWCAIRCNSVSAVQAALGLHNAKPCSWGEGVAHLAEHSLLISPPIRGWVVVVGNALPDPAEDADNCFHFLRRVSRTLGHVQFFSVHAALSHHAWVRLEDGCVLRAYAWAGQTLWNQGDLTRSEIELGLKCFAYGESPIADAISPGELLQANVDRISLLAARWSVDPASLNESTAACGPSVVGDLIHSRKHG